MAPKGLLAILRKSGYHRSTPKPYAHPDSAWDLLAKKDQEARRQRLEEQANEKAEAKAEAKKTKSKAPKKRVAKKKAAKEGVAKKVAAKEVAKEEVPVEEGEANASPAYYGRMTV
ncbi:hypothetical protein LTR87_016458 [Friedmanniomyces endolithicus]|nr:hypothetical protein LTR75_016288 [Friedmanniomyces endolithicus]KAK0862804.1 hypothetical protein LTR87_016458 [Friedmanniomyces endolithicus]